jgi:nitrogen fixation/metabolism regulation signal transduction histidine kinase
MKHQDNLQNTIRSLYIELIHKVEHEENLRDWSSEGYYNLDQLLKKFSNVFYADINLYDEAGLLLASSRNEIFDQQFLSIRMNREAFEKLSLENYSVFIHSEQIGRMTYQSAYVPLLNSENNLLAYLNLPYFTEPEMLTQEVTNLVVVILNTYVILLLLILFLSVFLADRITQPLRFIQNKIAHLSLSRNNEKIVYSGKDEIAGLVDEYNYMVDELVKSAELLAQSERESAWREMAKQIAHEIKNPLTPMKLNVQHMQRMIKEDGANIAEQVDKVSQSLIEQIDSLTTIANEFSDFAKMPKARNRKINLVTKLRNVANLFENSEGFNINLELGGLTEVRTYGDPEQFQRMIINLVKNGIQSVPDDVEKKITITMERWHDNTVLIAVSDNGKGIPESIQDKLFQPNFTTKSAGMGMGLAISANIIKSMNGEIWFKTAAGEGTTFFVKIPVLD